MATTRQKQLSARYLARFLTVAALAVVALLAMGAFMRAPQPVAAQGSQVEVWLSSNGAYPDCDDPARFSDPDLELVAQSATSINYTHSVEDTEGHAYPQFRLYMCVPGDIVFTGTVEHGWSGYGAYTEQRGNIVAETSQSCYLDGWEDWEYDTDSVSGCGSVDYSLQNEKRFGGETCASGTVARYRIEIWEAALAFCNPQVAYGEVSISIAGEIGEQEENHCPDGIELITNTVSLGSSGSWSGSTSTAWDSFYARYTFEDPATSSLIHHVYLEANDEAWGATYYGDEMQEWTPGDGWTNDAYAFTVPNRTYPTLPDYDPFGSVAGPTAYVTVTNSYNPLDLVSVCVVPHYGPSSYCENGIEAVNGGPVYLDALNGAWSETVPVTSTHVVVQYVTENLAGGQFVAESQHIAGIENTLYYVSTASAPGDMITFTLPTTGVVKLYDDDVFLELYNRGEAVLLHSVCVVDADQYMPQLSAESCHLENPDFVGGLDGWGTSGSVTWSGLEENGAIQATGGGGAYQVPDQGTGTVWRMEVRAKSTGTPDLVYLGTSGTSILAGGPQVYSYTVGQYYSIVGEDVFVREGDTIQVSGADAWIDSVCLVDPNSVLPIQNCAFPTWNPSGSADSLLTYLIKYLADVVVWGICEVVRAITLAINWIYRLLKDMLLRVPALPDPDDGLVGWLEWIALLFDGYFQWFGINLPTFAEWFPRNLDRLVAFLFDLYEEFIYWLADQLQVDPWDLFDLMDAIWAEALLFWNEMVIEMGLEWQDLLLLLQNTANVLIVLLDGVREGVSGENVAYIGRDFSGIGSYIWVGVDFINEVISGTPLSALNLVALGVITITLAQWTAKRFTKSLESVS